MKNCRETGNINLKKSAHAAYTLVEMSIVIVIIGLVIAAVMTSVNIVKGAKSTSLISEFSYYRSAIDNFKNIYNFYPGDMPTTEACNAFGSVNASYNCNTSSQPATTGNNRIDDEGSSYYENMQVWLQLTAAGLTPFSPSTGWSSVNDAPGRNIPISKTYSKENAGVIYVGRTVVSGLNFFNVLRIGKSNGSGSFSSGSDFLPDPVVPIAVMIDIDRKIDEPNTPLKGRFFAIGPCVNGTNINAVYKAENSNTFCSANLAEFDSSQTSNADNQM